MDTSIIVKCDNETELEKASLIYQSYGYHWYIKSWIIPTHKINYPVFLGLTKNRLSSNLKPDYRLILFITDKQPMSIKEFIERY